MLWVRYTDKRTGKRGRWIGLESKEVLWMVDALINRMNITAEIREVKP